MSMAQELSSSDMSPAGPVVGIDCGARRGAFFVSGPGLMTPVVRRCEAGDPRVFYDLTQVSRWIDLAFAPWRVVIEAPIVGASGNGQTAVKIAMAVGAIAAGFSCPVDLKAPASWKKEVIGHGHASKADVESFLRAHHPEITEVCSSYPAKDRVDLYDAACLALAARSDVASPSPVP